MSKTQLKILWIGMVIFVLMGLFPPKEYNTPEGSHADGYGFIFTVDNIDFSRLIVQWAIVAVVTGGLIYSIKVDPELMPKIRSWFSGNVNTNEKLAQQNNNRPKTD